MYKTNMGEYLVGACLKYLKGCQFIVYNTALMDLYYWLNYDKSEIERGEIDVLGFDFKNNRCYVCEVTIHLYGTKLGSGSNVDTIDTIFKKFEKNKRFSDKNLTIFKEIIQSYWSPYVTKGVREGLEKIDGLELVINEKFKKMIENLQELVKNYKQSWNPGFRLLQILGNLRDK